MIQVVEPGECRQRVCECEQYYVSEKESGPYNSTEVQLSHYDVFRRVALHYVIVSVCIGWYVVCTRELSRAYSAKLIT